MCERANGSTGFDTRVGLRHLDNSVANPITVLDVEHVIILDPFRAAGLGISKALSLGPPLDPSLSSASMFRRGEATH